MCFAPQWRALFQHLNCQKWPGAGVFCTFWLGNVLRATTACTFRHLNFQKWSERGVFCTFWLRNVLRATAECTFSSLIWPVGSAPAALASLLFKRARRRLHARCSDLMGTVETVRKLWKWKYAQKFVHKPCYFTVRLFADKLFFPDMTEGASQVCYNRLGWQDPQGKKLQSTNWQLVTFPSFNFHALCQRSPAILSELHRRCRRDSSMMTSCLKHRGLGSGASGMNVTVPLSICDCVANASIGLQWLFKPSVNNIWKSLWLPSNRNRVTEGRGWWQAVGHSAHPGR